MSTLLELGGFALEVVRKDIKNVHLSVHPPSGRVRIAAPERMGLEVIRLYVITKLDWIRQQQGKLNEQEREGPREYLDRESHYVGGRRRLLKVVEVDGVPSVQVKHRTLHLTVRPGASEATKAAVLAGWYRDTLRTSAQPIIESWEHRLAVQVRALYVQQMKTKWGSCNPKHRTIRLNTELAKKPRECLEYIVVHEMLHLLESPHTPRFFELMNWNLPGWQETRALLNRLPAGHQRWRA
ncbi:MAG TPA: SprT family zinc-dependent metalloprotease [Planctomycetota bacterium]|nr:SprT family zinc-dependent metalloprotease [Planctomycetota bacterium]